MALLTNIKFGIDIPRWQQMAPAATHAAGGSLCTDQRNDVSNLGLIFHLVSATVLNCYVAPYNNWLFSVSPALSLFGAGSCAVVAPSAGVRGSIGAGCSTTKIVTTTVIASVGVNKFTISEGLGLRVRIIGKSAGGSGIIEERMIVGNTSGTTPTLYLDTALSFVPAVGDTYEILSMRVFCLGNGATAATQFRYFDFATLAMTSCAGTGLTIATDSSMIALDELYVPYDRAPGEGFIIGASTYDAGAPKGCLLATASAAGTLTGQAAAGDAAVIANEYRNFQIRIVEDTAIPTAVGQRRIIASHTGLGASPVYTLGSNWSVTPSANCKYVIENPNLILLFTVAGGTAVYTYNYTPDAINNGTTNLATNTWSSTYFGARAAAVAAGTITFPSWGHEPTLSEAGIKLSRHSFIYSFRGGATTLDMLDIAGGASGLWTNAIDYFNQGTAISTGSCGQYAPCDHEGRLGYFVLNNTTIVLSFDVKYRSMNVWAALPAQAGTAAVGERVVVVPYVWGAPADRISMIFIQSHLAAPFYRSEVIV
jgi:hypothetical protein